MTDKEKARELSHKWIGYYKNSDVETVCLEMAAWKQEQLTQKAWEWLEPVFKDLAGYNCGGDLINSFKKAMEADE